MELRLELVLVPVSDVDRAKEFYVEKAGFQLDVDSEPGGGLRVVQMTPPGSACSITIGTGITGATPGERLPGLDPDRGRYASFAGFSDPDGNTWLLQEA
jgi:catechol 2,3-dioxygenase-like lactoylglutathione lyase family enzyme